MFQLNIYNSIKALLIFGSALMFVCCGGAKSTTQREQRSKERVMTESSDSLTVVMSENGRPSYIFSAPVVEGYSLAKEPYREFPKGVRIITFSKDSVMLREGELLANYAIYYEERKLWEAMGDVEVRNSNGKELKSQQLFWNAQSKRIYSNVDTKIADSSTGDVYYGEGFESDEAMEEWSFRRMTGRMKMTVKPNEPDSLSLDNK